MRALRAAGLGREAMREITVGAMNARSGQEAAGGCWRRARRCRTRSSAPTTCSRSGCCGCCCRRGLKVPDDIALIGYDDIEFSAAAAVPLSSVRQPTYQLGRIATELLLDECDDPGGHAHQQVMFQPELVVRESSRPGGGGRT